MCHPEQQFANTIVTPGRPPFFSFVLSHDSPPCLVLQIFHKTTVLFAFMPLGCLATITCRVVFEVKLQADYLCLTFQRKRILFFWQ